MKSDNEQIHDELVKEITPYESEFGKWLDENEGKIDRIDLYIKVSQYPISEMAKLHLVHGAGRALYIHGWR